MIVLFTPWQKSIIFYLSKIIPLFMVEKRTGLGIVLFPTYKHQESFDSKHCFFWRNYADVLHNAR